MDDEVGREAVVGAVALGELVSAASDSLFIAEVVSAEAEAIRLLEELRKRAELVTSAAIPEIVEGLAEKAKRGSVIHIKLLFEVSGINEKRAKQGKRTGGNGPSLGRVLFEDAKKCREMADRLEEAESRRLPAIEEDPRPSGGGDSEETAAG